MTTPQIYRKIDAVLDVLSNYKNDNVEAVNTLLQTYNAVLKSYEEKGCAQTLRRHPLIVLEGLDGSGKSTVSKRLATKIKAVQWCTPPESIKPIRNMFDDHPKLRTAYYALGNYIAALEVAVILQNQPVVMDRYWQSTAAFAIAQAVNDFPGDLEMPPKGDSFYHWPEDLLKPDAVLFLNVDEPVRLQRLSRRADITSQEELMQKSEKFRDNVIMAYKNMVDPYVTFINCNPGFNIVLREIGAKIECLLK